VKKRSEGSRNGSKASQNNLDLYVSLTNNWITDEHQTSWSVSDFLLTQEQLIENEYPLPSWLSEASQLEDDWLQIPEFREHDDPGSEPRVLALDCEMVGRVT
jgi:hypothetical protein